MTFQKTQGKSGFSRGEELWLPDPNLLIESLKTSHLALNGLLCVTLIWGSGVVKAQKNRDSGRRKEAREEGVKGTGSQDGQRL